MLTCAVICLGLLWSVLWPIGYSPLFCVSYPFTNYSQNPHAKVHLSRVMFENWFLFVFNKHFICTYYILCICTWRDRYFRKGSISFSAWCLWKHLLPCQAPDWARNNVKSNTLIWQNSTRLCLLSECLLTDFQTWSLSVLQTTRGLNSLSAEALPAVRLTQPLADPATH